MVKLKVDIRWLAKASLKIALIGVLLYALLWCEYLIRNEFDFVRISVDMKPDEYAFIIGGTVEALGDGKYTIVRSSDDRRLMIRNHSLHISDLLGNLTNYKKYRQYMFVVSDMGVGVADGLTNESRFYFFNEYDKIYERGATDGKGNVMKRPPIRDPLVRIIDSYDEFTPEEQAIFEELRANPRWK